MQPNAIKCFYLNEWRRFAITWPQDNLFRHLKKEIKDNLRLQSESSLVLRYLDEDEDLVTFDTDSELSHVFQMTRNGVLKVYAEDTGNGVNGQQNGFQWRPFSEQEKMAIRKGFSAAEAVTDFVKPAPTLTITRKSNGGSDGCSVLSQALFGSAAAGPADFIVTQQREGFGANASTAQVGVKVLSFAFEIYNAATSKQ